MLTGEFGHSIDIKNRIFVPVKFREELGATFIIARDIRGKRLKIFSLSEWEKYIEPIMAQDRKTSEKALRFLHRNAVQVTPDTQGRVVLPSGLIEYAQIEKSAVFVGCSTYAELWSEELYNEQLAIEDSEEMCEELEKFGL